MPTVTEKARMTKWARVKQSGAHGLRRGAWYLVVNDLQQSVVLVNVRQHNVPVPRTMVELREGRPDTWSVVEWQNTQRGVRRVSEQGMGLRYAVCPACSERAPIVPPDAAELTCVHCQGVFAVDWDHPC